MKKFSIIFHVILFIYLLLSIILLLNLDAVSKMFGLNSSFYLTYWAFLGLILYGFLWIRSLLLTTNLRSKLRNMESRKNKYKADFYKEKEKSVKLESKGDTKSLTQSGDSQDPKL